MKQILNGILEALDKLNAGAQPYYGAGDVTESIGALREQVETLQGVAAAPVVDNSAAVTALETRVNELTALVEGLTAPAPAV